jgi:drug/metabolite transporter (DMT)-like permease
MSSTILLLTLSSALLHALRDLLIKKSADKLSFSWLFRVLGLVIILPAAAIRFQSSISSSGWVLIGSSAVIHALYTFSLARAYDKGDLSLVYPVARSAPIFVLLWSTLVWREPMTTPGVAGILIIVLGAYLLQVRGFSIRDLTEPIRMTIHDRSLRFAWVTAVLVAVYSLIDDRGVAMIDPLVFLLLYGSITCVLLAPHLLFARRAEILREWRLRWPLLLAAAVASSGGYLLALFALRLGHVGPL